MNLIKNIKIIFRDFINFIITYMPGTVGRKVRYFYYKKKLKYLGKNVLIDEGVIIQTPKFISINDNTWIDKYVILIAGKVNLERAIVKKKVNSDFKYMEGELIIEKNVHVAPYCIIQANSGVQIGDNVVLSSGVKIYSLSNMPNNPNNPAEITYASPFIPAPESSKVAFFSSPVVIGNNVWIALNSIVLSGAVIGENSFIRSNSIVLNYIPPNSYATGDPAKRMRKRFELNES